ncbi:lipoprotein-releasing ABC transporter permease subunit LolC [Proteus hauseri]|uniref:lipoprotein-releasing ABC transporter permease subunit LolC n=1 Tax=Proteus hauseri TaxID=183417 RepID=UPI0010094137|nr:lipoprotein-releasing ABC transporter permease subunit LolC [Proteus hauseri]QAV24335.1 lipoprotein-releasing system transmembrane subunit LolC [Proteus hauseri]
MYNSVSFFIGLRYMRGRAVDKFGRFVSWLSALGIMLGVAALITVTSVMNGFERSLQDSILAYIPQAIITTPNGQLPKQDSTAQTLLKREGVINVVPLVEGDVVLQSKDNISVGIMLGVEKAQDEPLTQYIRYGNFSMLKAGEYGVILGNNLAKQLKAKEGDKIRLIVPSVSQLTPMGRVPSQRLFTVKGIFQSGGDADASQVLVNQQDAARLMRYQPGNITGWRLFFSSPLNIEKYSAQSLPEGLSWKDWRERKGEFFQAVKMEKNMMGLLLSLIIAVAAFNIITSLSLLVMEKQGEVAILQTMGLKRTQIMSIFMLQGAGAGIMGAIAGGLLGALLSSQLNTIMPAVGLIPHGVELPATLEWGRVFIIGFAAIVISLLSTLYPSWRAATIQPAEALRYE